MRGGADDGYPNQYSEAVFRDLFRPYRPAGRSGGSSLDPGACAPGQKRVPEVSGTFSGCKSLAGLGNGSYGESALIGGTADNPEPQSIISTDSLEEHLEHPESDRVVVVIEVEPLERGQILPDLRLTEVGHRSACSPRGTPGKG